MTTKKKIFKKKLALILNCCKVKAPCKNEEREVLTFLLSQLLYIFPLQMGKKSSAFPSILSTIILTITITLSNINLSADDTLPSLPNTSVNPDNTNSTNNWSVAAFLKDQPLWFNSMLRGVGAGIIFQPFDVIKTNSQASLRGQESLFNVFRDIIKNDGFFGLFKGVRPAIGRSVVRDTLRFPMIMNVPKFYSEKLGTDNIVITQACTGASIAMVETLVLSPFERAKVFEMTKSIRDKTKINLSINNLFRGFKYQTIASSVGWSSFLITRDLLTSNLKKLQETDNLNTLQLSGIGILSGLATTLTFMPIDACKTLVQKAKPEKDIGLLGLISKIIKTKGPMGLYAGWQMTLGSLIINSIINVNFINWLGS